MDGWNFLLPFSILSPSSPLVPPCSKSPSLPLVPSSSKTSASLMIPPSLWLPPPLSTPASLSPRLRCIISPHRLLLQWLRSAARIRLGLLSHSSTLVYGSHGCASALWDFYSNSACQPIRSTLAPRSLGFTWDCRLFGSSRLPRISDSTLVRCRSTPSSALAPSSIDYSVGHPNPGFKWITY